MSVLTAIQCGMLDFLYQRRWFTLVSLKSTHISRCRVHTSIPSTAKQERSSSCSSAQPCKILFAHLSSRQSCAEEERKYSLRNAAENWIYTCIKLQWTNLHTHTHTINDYLHINNQIPVSGTASFNTACACSTSASLTCNLHSVLAVFNSCVFILPTSTSGASPL